MCFSATASFSAGALLLGVGALTLRTALAAHQRRALPFAAIPLLFALQQLSEGVIWLTFSYEAPLLNSVMTHVYSFFSHVLWPVYVPVAVLLMEPMGWRRRALFAFVAAGPQWARTCCTSWWGSRWSRGLRVSTSSTSHRTSSRQQR